MEDVYCEMFARVRKAIEEVSVHLRSIQNSRTVAIPALCDILVLYANTETYFTTNEDYKRFRGEDIVVRRCDVRHKEGA
jgi:hypothetical protein